MKRGWLGLGLLVFLLALGLAAQTAMEKIHADCVQVLQQAEEASLQEDWELALELSSQAQRQWQKHYTFTASLADHAPMDDVDKLYAELRVYGQEQDKAHFAATCGQLASMLQAVAEAHKLNLRNLL